MEIMRKIIEIDEELCNGCGQCIIDCAEGAIQIIDGKAKVISDNLCDGLGACIGNCPEDALKIIERVAEDFDEEAVEKHLEEQKKEAGEPETMACGCPSSQIQAFPGASPCEAANKPTEVASAESALGHWPVQIRLIPPTAPFLKGADLLIAADCVPVAYPHFHQDFLKADLEKELTPIFGEADIYVAANLPYYITSPCIMKLVESGLNIKRITVMIQKEVAQRICAMPGSKEYGSISAAIGFFADAKMLFSVSPSCFYPKPDVYSAVLSIEMKQYDAEKAEQYSKTVRGLFAKRRKTVRSNLRQSFELTIGQANAIIQKAQIDENARAETLNVNDFARISEEIVNIQKNIEN